MTNRKEELDVLVVGAGFAGLYQLYYLRKLGYKVKALEKASGLGGIWYWQTYPGARVDTDAPLYEYSMEDLWKGWNYAERYPARAEILQYFKYVDEKLDLSKDILFNTRVVSAEFDSTSNKWHVHTAGGEVFVARFLTLCIGFGAKPYDAPFKGLEEYKGIVHHSNNWPQEVDLQGKRVAIVGTGATGVQIIQEIGPQVGHLTVFQRTPNLALPMHNPKLSELEEVKDKQKHFKLRYECYSGFTYTSHPTNAFDHSYEARQAFYEQQWAYGDFRFWLAGYADLFSDEKSNNDAYEFWCKKVRARIHKPEMQDKLAPLKPPHPFGTKRPSLERSYYEVFNQPNVDLIDISANPLECFTSSGIRTQDGVEHQFDVVVLATGFDAITGAVNEIHIKGTAGHSMKEKWNQGVRTYLGMTSNGFPNLFFAYNAQAPTAFSNGPSCVELQGEWIVKFVDHVVKSSKSRIDATEQAEEGWVEKVHELYKATLFAKAASWYIGRNIPGKVIEPLCFMGGIPMYKHEIDLVATQGYAGFVIS